MRLLLGAGIFVLFTVPTLAESPASDASSDRAGREASLALATERHDPDASAAVRFDLREDFARDFAAFLRECFPGRIRASIRRDPATELSPNPQVRLTVRGTPEITKPLGAFVGLFLVRVAEDLDSSSLERLRSYRMEPNDGTARKASRPTTTVASYRLPPKKARSLGLIVSRHAQAPIRIRIEADRRHPERRLVRVTTLPSYHKVIGALLEQVEPGSTGRD